MKRLRRSYSSNVNRNRSLTLAFLSLSVASILMSCGGLGKSPTPESQPDPQLNQSVNHIIFMVQENRGFDHYFGKLADYWQENGYPTQQFDGLPANASNPMVDANNNVIGSVNSFHFRTVCMQNMSPGWNESHVDWNRTDPVNATPMLDGFVQSAGNFARNTVKNGVTDDMPGGFSDTEGLRAMGYYDGNDLNYYYFMASNFATSDRWFSPIMSRTPPNRLYLLAATSAGHANPPKQPLSNKTIFEQLETAGVSWKIYLTDPNTAFLENFQPFGSQHESKIVKVDPDYYNDVKNGTLPSVAMIEGGYESGLDEHPNQNIQKGAAHVANIINKLMVSDSWKDTVFILTFDEGGGFYDHVAPHTGTPTEKPDDLGPMDLNPGTNGQGGDICTTKTGPNCDFVYTGFRIPLIVISPFTKKNFVSHTVADYTAILKLIETRFAVDNLTKRDAAQMDMTEFFDFANPPWTTSPPPPDQNLSGVCDYDPTHYGAQ